jgi:hypothetical protein
VFASGQEQFWNNPDDSKGETKGATEDVDEDTNM